MTLRIRNNYRDNPCYLKGKFSAFINEFNPCNKILGLMFVDSRYPSDIRNSLKLIVKSKTINS